MWRFCFSLQLATACGWCHHSALTVSTVGLGNYVARFMLILRAAAFYCYSRASEEETECRPAADDLCILGNV